jgi:prephenate dehydrogenase
MGIRQIGLSLGETSGLHVNRVTPVIEENRKQMIRIAIIGMGLIGTSLGMALRTADAQTSALGPVQIVGYDQEQAATRAARGRLAIDQATRSLAEALQGTQLVVIATPVQTVRAILTQLAPLLPANAIVTDTASTKAEVCAWAAELLPETVHFVGGHPMAGKEQTGPQAADPDLFRNAIYCLTPATNVPQTAIDAVEALVTTVEAKPYYIDPAEHDAYVAGISHLPFLLATALVETTSQSPAWREMAPLAASGFRDTSRLASGDPTMYRDICLTNRAALTRWINETISFLLEMRDHLEAAEAEQLEARFTHARQTRDAWLNQQPGQRPGEAAFDTPPHQVERPGWFGRRKPPERGQRS